jgi:hypothetical protein
LNGIESPTAASMRSASALDTTVAVGTADGALACEAVAAAVGAVTGAEAPAEGMVEAEFPQPTRTAHTSVEGTIASKRSRRDMRFSFVGVQKAHAGKRVQSWA